MNDPHRATGRTFRTVMEAITAASKGNHVYVSFHSHDSCSRNIRLTIKVIEAWSSHVIKSVKPSNKTIEIDGGGKISFITHEQLNDVRFIRMAGHNAVFMSDHYLGEEFEFRLNQRREGSKNHEKTNV